MVWFKDTWGFFTALLVLWLVEPIRNLAVERWIGEPMLDLIESQTWIPSLNGVQLLLSGFLIGGMVFTIKPQFQETWTYVKRKRRIRKNIDMASRWTTLAKEILGEESKARLPKTGEINAMNQKHEEHSDHMRKAYGVRATLALTEITQNGFEPYNWGELDPCAKITTPRLWPFQWINFANMLLENSTGVEMPNLKQARDGKIEDFIKEHEADPGGDLDKLNALIKRPIEKGDPKAAPAKSKEPKSNLKGTSKNCPDVGFAI